MKTNGVLSKAVVGLLVVALIGSQVPELSAAEDARLPVLPQSVGTQEPVIKPAGFWIACLVVGAAVGAGVGLYYLNKKCKKIKPRTFDDDDTSTNTPPATNIVAQFRAASAGDSAPPTFVTGPVDSCNCGSAARAGIVAASEEVDPDGPVLVVTTTSGLDENGTLTASILSVKTATMISEEQAEAEQVAHGWPIAGPTETASYVGTNRVTNGEAPLRVYNGRIVLMNGPGYENAQRVLQHFEVSYDMEHWTEVAAHGFLVGMKVKTFLPQDPAQQMFVRMRYEPSPF